MVGFYKDLLKRSSFSDVRYQFIEATVRYLKGKGKVILIRMPVHQDIYQNEQELIPDFDKRIETVAKKLEVRYLNFSVDQGWEFKDGAHLKKSSAFDFSILLSDKLVDINLE
ncbi:MAG: hypothetical protein WD431_16255 [Cyclobacteriaceae bacterium]